MVKESECRNSSGFLHGGPPFWRVFMPAARAPQHAWTWWINAAHCNVAAVVGDGTKAGVGWRQPAMRMRFSEGRGMSAPSCRGAAPTCPFCRSGGVAGQAVGSADPPSTFQFFIMLDQGCAFMSFLRIIRARFHRGVGILSGRCGRGSRVGCFLD